MGDALIYGWDYDSEAWVAIAVNSDGEAIIDSE